MSPLVTSEILGLFNNTLKLFPEFLLNSWIQHQILIILKKQMTFISDVFPRLRAAKDVLR